MAPSLRPESCVDLVHYWRASVCWSGPIQTGLQCVGLSVCDEKGVSAYAVCVCVAGTRTRDK